MMSICNINMRKNQQLAAQANGIAARLCEPAIPYRF
jgi:hypothetical protein